MTYENTYEAIFDLYNPETAWKENTTTGNRQSLNLGYEALGRHANSSAVALRLRDFETGDFETYTYAELNAAANSVANYLEVHTDRAARIAVMLPARLELYAALFGTLKSGMVYVPLASVFGPDAIEYRLNDSSASIFVTESSVLDSLDSIPDSVEYVITVDESENRSDSATESIGVNTFEEVLEYESSYTAVDTHPNDPYALTYTSGTTGQPKGVLKSHRSAIESYAYPAYVTDLRSDDVYFAAAPPAWSYGLIRGTIGPGLVGTAIGAYRGSFDPELLLETFERFEVTNAMIPPTALRRIQNDSPQGYDIDLRVLVTVGESLDAETVEWARGYFGTTPLDGYGLTEAGMVICNYGFDDWELKPGSMGRPVPGREVTLLDESGNSVEQGEVGEISIRRTESPTPIYWRRPEATLDQFTGQWIRTGDLARKDSDGYFWYVGRADSVIVSSGYRIGPEEVEETVRRHPVVTDVVVVGVPDEVRGEIVKAYVVTDESTTPTDDLADRIAAFTRRELSKHEYPREIEFVEAFPTTATGKIDRNKLETREAANE